jgi:hypothetical protein
MLGEPLRPQKKTRFAPSVRRVFFVWLASGYPLHHLLRHFMASQVVTLLSLSRKAEPFLSQNALAQAHLLQAVEIKFRSLYKLK